MQQMCEMADGLRSTRKVIEFLPIDSELLPPGPKKEEMIEIMALAIEAYVRAADECFPKASAN